MRLSKVFYSHLRKNFQFFSRICPENPFNIAVLLVKTPFLIKLLGYFCHIFGRPPCCALIYNCSFKTSFYPSNCPELLPFWSPTRFELNIWQDEIPTKRQVIKFYFSFRLEIEPPTRQTSIKLGFLGSGSRLSVDRVLVCLNEDGTGFLYPNRTNSSFGIQENTELQSSNSEFAD